LNGLGRTQLLNVYATKPIQTKRRGYLKQKSYINLKYERASHFKYDAQIIKLV